MVRAGSRNSADSTAQQNIEEDRPKAGPEAQQVSTDSNENVKGINHIPFSPGQKAVLITCYILVLVALGFSIYFLLTRLRVVPSTGTGTGTTTGGTTGGTTANLTVQEVDNLLNNDKLQWTVKQVACRTLKASSKVESGALSTGPLTVAGEIKNSPNALSTGGISCSNIVVTENARVDGKTEVKGILVTNTLKAETLQISNSIDIGSQELKTGRLNCASIDAGNQIVSCGFLDTQKFVTLTFPLTANNTIFASTSTIKNVVVHLQRVGNMVYGHIPRRIDSGDERKVNQWRPIQFNLNANEAKIDVSDFLPKGERRIPVILIESLSRPTGRSVVEILPTGAMRMGSYESYTNPNGAAFGFYMMGAVGWYDVSFMYSVA